MQQALVSLGADITTLEKFKILDKVHLSLPKDLMEENRFYQRNDVLPWFWMLVGESEDKQSDWMSEGMLSYLNSKEHEWLIIDVDKFTESVG